MIAPELLRQARIESVAHSLREDIGDGDITAMLIPADKTARGRVITRENARLAGVEWVNEVFRQVDPNVELEWLFRDGDDRSEEHTSELQSRPHLVCRLL